MKVLLLIVSTFVLVSADWWERATFYQIYPRSFKDDNNDGIGDLKGIISKLEHLKDIGVTATWLSPIFKSPQVDAGYDISDYRDVDPQYGTFEDLKDLIKKAKELGIKLILDFVPNHTSDEHEWFQKSIEGDEEYSDYFIWREGRNNNTEPPNNWVSVFKGSAWKFNEKRNLWYYHLFAEQQPDLNFRNPKVVQAMKDTMIFWLDQGIDGFRIDAVPHLFEDENLTDEPVNPNTQPGDWNSLNHINTINLNETFDMIYQWRQLMDEYTDQHGGDTRILMSEAATDFDAVIKYYGLADGSRKGVHFSFNFYLVRLTNDTTSEKLKNSIDAWLNGLPEIYTVNWVTGNHDNPRVASTLGQDNANAISMLQAILPGIQITYNGEEIAMEDGPVTCEEGQDPSAIKNCSTFAENSRDFERTPMQWDNSTNAGFNDGAKTWLPVSPKYLETNVAQQKGEERSQLKIYKKLMDMRKDIPDSAKTETDIVKGHVLRITRTLDNEKYVYLYNRLGDKTRVGLNGHATVVVSSLNSNKPKGFVVYGKITLKRNECVILRQSL